MSTISNERLEKLSEYDCADRYEVMSMATELLALRKELKKAEPVCFEAMPFTWEELKGMHGADFATGYVRGWERKCASLEMKGALYTAQTAAAHVDEIAAQAGIDPAIADAYMQGCHDTEARQAETDTTSQQFESLAGKAVGGWIPCGERLPGIGEEVLMRISCSDHFNIESGRYKGDGLWLGCWFSTYGKKESPYQVGHWMPIPAAPEPCK